MAVITLTKRKLMFIIHLSQLQTKQSKQTKIPPPQKHLLLLLLYTERDILSHCRTHYLIIYIFIISQTGFATESRIIAHG